MIDTGLSLIKKRSGSKKGHVWAISYSDMVTALLCFFIIFYSLEKQIEKKTGASSGTSIDRGPAMLGGLSGVEGVKTELKGNFLEIDFPSDVFFNVGDVELNKLGQQRLLAVIPKLQEMKYQRIEVIAHTDNRPVADRSDRWWKNNKQLSALRALQAGTFLSSQGIDERKLIYSGHGEKNFDQRHDADRRLTLRIHL